MSTNKNWFDVDHKGLSKLIERRGKGALIFELVANALDADGTTRVEIILEPEQGLPLTTVIVRDDAPGGFADLSHAWTLVAESGRKAYAQKRGRFNLGEKLVLALCTEASIISVKDAVMFDARGRTSMRARRDSGTEFQGIARISRAELAEIKQDLRRIISPPGVTILVNNEELPARLPIASFGATIATEIADDEGVLRRSARKTVVHVYEPLPGMPPMLHELGIPVVETGDRWDVSIDQKIPLNMDRDNVTPTYMRDTRTLVVNAMHWVKVDQQVLLQDGALRVRLFKTAEAARSVVAEFVDDPAKETDQRRRARVARQARGFAARRVQASARSSDVVPGYSNFGGGGPFAPMGAPHRMPKRGST